MSQFLTVREHEPLAESGLGREDLAELANFARRVLKHNDGDLAASNFVGVVTTRRGTVLEILPKIDLDHDVGDPTERTRRVFLEMLRPWRRVPKQLPHSDIRAMSRFPMLEVFVRQFLHLLTALVRGGMARRYVNVEENLPYLRGRLLFSDHLRENACNRTRFYTTHDELSVNRPANRLIHATLVRLAPRIRNDTNRQLVRQSLIALADVPPSRDPVADWRAHHVDRSMNHYGPVMQWVRLFLFNRGLTTFSGANTNVSLLFPMEQVFEDFLVASFRQHQQQYTVVTQGLRKAMATIGDTSVFSTIPDIALRSGSQVPFILDAKWKPVDATTTDLKHGIAQDDVYQLHAYATRYGCAAVTLVYPRNPLFRTTLHYRFFDGIALLAIPFDVTQPRRSVALAVRELQNASSQRRIDHSSATPSVPSR